MFHLKDKSSAMEELSWPVARSTTVLAVDSFFFYLAIDATEAALFIICQSKRLNLEVIVLGSASSLSTTMTVIVL